MVAWVALTAALLAGCSDEKFFERFTGPLSPPGIAMVAAGGLREKLFPGSQRAYELCMDDPESCVNAGGISLQLSRSGRVALDHLKTMLALQLAGGKDDPQFKQACEAFANRLFEESDADGYEVSMRLLAFLTADPKSPLGCAVRMFNDRFTSTYESRRVDWDVVKLTGYVELMLASRKIFKSRGMLGRGFLARAGKTLLTAGSGYLLYRGAKGTARMLELDRWTHDSATLFFVGDFNWSRKYANPVLLMDGFRRTLEGYVVGASVQGLSTDLNHALNP